jgi:hypothetical protein
MRVLSKIGLGFHSLKDLEKAKEYQQLHVAIAQETLEPTFRHDAFVQLARVFLDLAAQNESKKNFTEANDMYKSFLEVRRAFSFLGGTRFDLFVHSRGHVCRSVPRMRMISSRWHMLNTKSAYATTLSTNQKKRFRFLKHLYVLACFVTD